jgi:glycosyltransferase involved in cell wall biosynthesis
MFYVKILSISMKYKSNNKKIFCKDKLSVALVFSSKHFDPYNNNKGKYINSGSAYWAKYFYNFFISRFNVSYFDINDECTGEISYDIILGLVSKNYLKLCKSNKDAYKILFAVNSHPIFRNMVILNECVKFKLPLILMEVINPFVYLNCINVSDHILLLGNEAIKNTYLTSNVPSDKISIISGTPDNNIFKKKQDYKNSSIKIVYPAGFNGVRKGILRFIESWNTISAKHSEVDLTVLGGFDPNVRKLLIRSIHPHTNIEFIEWLPHSSLVDKLSASDIVVLMSLEEGQVYSVMEAIFCGCIPLISKNCGIDLPEEYIINNPYDQDEITFKLDNIISNIEYYKLRNSSIINILHESSSRNSCDNFLNRLLALTS